MLADRAEVTSGAPDGPDMEKDPRRPPSLLPNFRPVLFEAGNRVAFADKGGTVIDGCSVLG